MFKKPKSVGNKRISRGNRRQSNSLMAFDRLEFRHLLATVNIYAAGSTGSEQMELLIDDQVVAQFNNVGGNYESGQFQTFTFTTAATVAPGQVRVAFTNNNDSPPGVDRNLRVDRIAIGTVSYQSEAESVYSLGHWTDGIGCDQGYLQTETLHCNGYFQFADAPPPGGSTIVISAAGATGEEQVRLSIGGQLVKTWNNVQGDYGNGQFYDLIYAHPAAVSFEQVKIEFSNDGLTSGGEDKNLRVDRVRIDATTREIEGVSVFSDGHWLDAYGIVRGFLQVETLEGGGFFDFNAAAYPVGKLALNTNLVNVNEQTGIAQVSIVRTGGSVGLISVDYHTFADTATAGVDYTTTEGTVTFNDGETSKIVSIPINNDNAAESNEKFSITIDNPGGGATLLAPRTGQIVIIDNDSGNVDPLVGHWKLNEAAIGAVGDSSTYANNGTHLNMVVPSGPTTDAPLLSVANPRSVNFDGTNDYVSIVSGSKLNVTSSYTQSVWIRPTFTGLAIRGVLSGNNSAYPSISVKDVNKIQAIVGNGTISKTVTTGSVLQTNKWNHVAVTNDGATLRIYVNGIQVKSSTVAAGIQPPAISRFRIGTRGSYYFQGQIDEVRVYKSTLTTAEVQALYTAQQTSFTSQVVATLGGAVAVDWTPDGSKMFIGDFGGSVRILEGGQILSTPFIDISNQVNGTRGMLDLAVHPDFINKPYVYLAFAYDPPEVNQNTGLAGPDGAGNRACRLIRVTADASNGYRTAVPGSEVVLLGTNSTWQHYNGFVDSTVDFNEPPGGMNADGSYVRDFLAADSTTHTIDAVEFGPDGKLYVSNGDGASYNQVDPRAARVLDIDSLSGKILRIDPITGKGLADNPFYNGNPDDNRSKVYQYGLRNPFRMAFDAARDKLFVGDVGWYQWEEINSGGAGANFGWPYYEGGPTGNLQTVSYRDLAAAQQYYATNPIVTAPLVALSHSADNIDAVILGDVYDGGRYGAEFQGDLFFSYLGTEIMRRVNFNPDGTVASIESVADNIGSVVQTVTGPDGYLYSVDMNTGQIKKWVLA